MIEPFSGPWGMELESFQSLDSTSRYLWQQALDGALHGSVVVADQQFSGRGRRGRQWHSPPGKNLYFSILLRPRLPLDQVPQLSLVTAAALWTVLSQECVGLKIKWPNDLLCQGRKLAGILAEMKPGADNAEFVIIGVGLNVNAQAVDFPPELQGLVTSLSCECGRDFDLSELLHKILQKLAIFIDRFNREGLSGSIQDLINRNFFLAEKDVVVNSGDRQRECRAHSIDSSGRLLATDKDGQTIAFASGEAWLEKGLYNVSGH
ncbi:MAG: biotin--[acetyl-CoA-carboxylase] ligase [Deltaproteobacteria bacterium]|nr:biotin--[acetyl-CoA-carboxylase] ligase [Candidatus Tharpella sp.]